LIFIKLETMPDYVKRLQVLLTEEQFHFIHELAKKRRSSAGELMRHAMEEYYRPKTSEKKKQILKQIEERSYL